MCVQCLGPGHLNVETSLIVLPTSSCLQYQGAEQLNVDLYIQFLCTASISPAYFWKHVPHGIRRRGRNETERNFARTHHHDDDGPDGKKVKFDVRNPSALAPDAREDDIVLDADVIGGGGTKRGAVNIDGYDSDSDNETFAARADKRPQGSNDILHQLDNYDAKSKGGPDKSRKRR